VVVEMVRRRVRRKKHLNIGTIVLVTFLLGILGVLFAGNLFAMTQIGEGTWTLVGIEIDGKYVSSLEVTSGKTLTTVETITSWHTIEPYTTTIAEHTFTVSAVPDYITTTYVLSKIPPSKQFDVDDPCGGYAGLVPSSFDFKAVYYKTDAGYIVADIAISGYWEDSWKWSIPDYGRPSPVSCGEKIPPTAYFYLEVDKEFEYGLLKYSVPAFVELLDEENLKKSMTKMASLVSAGYGTEVYPGYSISENLYQPGEVRQPTWSYQNGILKLEIVGFPLVNSYWGPRPVTVKYRVYLAPQQGYVFEFKEDVIYTWAETTFYNTYKRRYEYSIKVPVTKYIVILKSGTFVEKTTATEEKIECEYTEITNPIYLYTWTTSTEYVQFGERLKPVPVPYLITYSTSYISQKVCIGALTATVVKTYSKVYVPKTSTVAEELAGKLIGKFHALEEEKTAKTTTTKTTIEKEKTVTTMTEKIKPTTITVTIVAPKTTFTTVISEASEAQQVASMYKPRKPLFQIIYENLVAWWNSIVEFFKDIFHF
jgi:hypothetical protein